MADTCPGCGLRIARTQPVSGLRYHASEGCLQRFEELSAYGYSRGDVEYRHQTVVDAYAAQHVAPDTPTIGPAFALIGLYLRLEHDRTGREVQQAHMVLAGPLGNQRRAWPRLDPPGRCGDMTVLDVLQAEPGETRDATALAWARSVWQAWEQKHAWVRATCEDLLPQFCASS